MHFKGITLSKCMPKVLYLVRRYNPGKWSIECTAKSWCIIIVMTRFSQKNKRSEWRFCRQTQFWPILISNPYVNRQPKSKNFIFWPKPKSSYQPNTIRLPPLIHPTDSQETLNIPKPKVSAATNSSYMHLASTSSHL